MKNSSRLLPEIDRKRSRSSSGCAGLRASSITRRLKASHDSSRLKKRSGPKEEAVVSASLSARKGPPAIDIVLHPAFRANRDRSAPVTVMRSVEHTSELQSLMRSSYAVFCLNKTTPPRKYKTYNIKSQVSATEH